MAGNFLDGTFPPRSKWTEYADYVVGDLVHVTSRALKPEYYWMVATVRQYHPASGVYTVFVERYKKELVLHKTEMCPAHDHSVPQ